MKHGNAALTRLWHTTLVFMVIAGLFAAMGPRQASAAGTVGRGTQESCTEAALNAALIGGGYISFNCGTDMATITVTGEKVITRNTRIAGGNRITLSGGGTTRVFRVDPGVSLEIETITVANGFAKDATGGAIQNNGTLTITQSSITNSRIEGRADGAGIYNAGTLTVNSSFFSENHAIDSGGLGNIGTATINGSIFSNNSGNWGGAITNRGTITINGSSITNNSAAQGYGAALYTNGGTMTVNDSFLGWNNAGMGAALFVNGGTANLNRVNIIDNTAGTGAGVYSMYGRLNVDSSTFSGNAAYGVGGSIAIGGGWSGSVPGTFGIVNSTFSGNSAAYGGGIASFGSNESSVSYSTFYGNDATTAGGGFYQEFGATKMTGVVFASNGGNCTGIDPVSDGHNLSSDPSCGFGQPSDKLSTDPMLNPLHENGGQTKTHSPATGSPLVEGGAATCPATDQRGNPRPNGARCDIGAVEGEAPADTAAPVATVPVHTFKQKGPITELNVPVMLSWSGTVDGYGIARYELERSTNGGEWIAVTLRDHMLTTHSITLGYGKSHQFRVRAIDRVRNVGEWATAATFTVKRYEETNAAVSYAGSWTSLATGATLGGTLKHTSVKDRSATFTFDGTSVGWVSSIGPSRGKALVYVDNVYVTSVDLYSKTYSGRHLVWKMDGLTDGQHTVRVRVMGTKNTASIGTRVEVTGFLALD